MKSNIALIICTTIIAVIFATCVTFAACYFRRTSILWWYIVIPVIQIIQSGSETATQKEGAQNESKRV